MSRRTLPRAGGPFVLLAVLAWLLPYQLNVYWISVADVAILFALLAVGMGLVMGVAGQVNLAQIAFFGVGAYATAILTTHDGYGFWTAAALAMVATALTGVVVGTPALRVQSHYLGIVTLGLAAAFIDWITNAPITAATPASPGSPRRRCSASTCRASTSTTISSSSCWPAAWPSGFSSSTRRSAAGCGRCGTIRWPPARRAPRSGCCE